MMIPTLETTPSLLAAMATAKSYKMCSQESLEQRVSYVFGCMSHGNTLTKQQIRDMIEK